MVMLVCVGIAAALALWPSAPRAMAGHRVDRNGDHVGRRRPSKGIGAVLWCAASAAVFGGAISWPVGVAVMVAGMMACRLVAHTRTAARTRAELATAAGAIGAVIRELDAGMTASDAVIRVCRGAPPAVAALLAPLRHDRGVAQWPGSSDDSNANANAKVNATATLSVRLRAAASLSAQLGVPLSSLLTALRGDIDNRIRAEADRSTQVAGPSVSGYVLAALPLAGVALGLGMGARPIAVLAGTTLGGFLLVIGVVLDCAGLWWVDRIVHGGVRG